MRVRSLALAFALTLTAATAAMAQSDVPGPGQEDGVVAQVDTANNVVKLEDGRMYHVEPGTELVFKGYPTKLGALQPGSYITITGGQPVIYQNGQYVRGVQN